MSTVTKLIGKLIDTLKKPETASLILRLVTAAGLAISPESLQYILPAYLALMTIVDKWWDAHYLANGDASPEVK